MDYINHLKPGFVLGYGLVLGVAGLAILFVLVNPLSGWMALLGWFAYIVIYTMWLKRTSTWSTSLGGIAGAMPPVIGYTAVTNEIDAGAWLLFALLFLWRLHISGRWVFAVWKSIVLQASHSYRWSKV